MRARAPLLSLIGMLLLVCFCLVGCSRMAQEKSDLPRQDNACADWKLASLIHSFGDVKFQGNQITELSDIAIDMRLDAGPVLTVRGGGSGISLMFDKPPADGAGTATVLFTTPEADDAHFRIPRFSPELLAVTDTLSVFKIDTYHDYFGSYSFEGAVAQSGGWGALRLVDCTCFNNGSTHHIAGQLRLFGLQFEPSTSIPLVFRIKGKEYVHLKGQGVIRDRDGCKFRIGG